MSDFAESLDKGFPEAWRPDKAGDPEFSFTDATIIGTFKETNPATTAYGPCWVVTLVMEDGREVAVWLTHTVLRNEFVRARPKPGERVGIKYLGRKDPKDPKSYVSYVVKVDRPHGEEFDWSKIGTDIEEPEPEYASAPPAPPREAVTVPAGSGPDDIPFAPTIA